MIWGQDSFARACVYGYICTVRPKSVWACAYKSSVAKHVLIKARAQKKSTHTTLTHMHREGAGAAPGGRLPAGGGVADVPRGSEAVGARQAVAHLAQDHGRRRPARVTSRGARAAAAGRAVLARRLPCRLEQPRSADQRVGVHGPADRRLLAYECRMRHLRVAVCRHHRSPRLRCRVHQVRPPASPTSNVQEMLLCIDVST
jgi:hypothetical protein